MLKQSLPVFLRLLRNQLVGLVVFAAVGFGQVETILHDFVALPHGSTPQSALIADKAGVLYGTTIYGGYGYGVVFKMAPDKNGKWTQTVIYTFNIYSSPGYYGTQTTASLALDGSGNLYLTTATAGCLNSCGVQLVSELLPNADGTWRAQTVYVFGENSSNDGSLPLAGVIVDSAGSLYGTTERGGANGFGTVYELTSFGSNQWSETILYNFTGGTDGGYPTGSLTFDAAGNLYGTSTVGGTGPCAGGGRNVVYGCGVVFELTAKINPDGTRNEIILHSFTGLDGSFPGANVIFDRDGNLLGTTPVGPGPNNAGTVFKMKPIAGGGWDFKTVYTFAGGLDGQTPSGGLVQGADGLFYGTTRRGGDSNSCQYGCGTVFELTPGSGFAWKERIIHHFSGSATHPYGVDGEFPAAGVVFDGYGNLYGTAPVGGSASAVAQCQNYSSVCGGTVFKLKRNQTGNWGTSVVYSFVSGTDGLNLSRYQGTGFVTSGLVPDSLGNLYGSTPLGGKYGWGTVYEMQLQSKGGYQERILYNFRNGSDGSQPTGPLLFDKSGNLLGLATTGGVSAHCTNSQGCGTVFELLAVADGTWTEKTIYTLTDNDSFSTPLVLDPLGNLFALGGGPVSGQFFVLSPASAEWKISSPYLFDSSIGFPHGLVADASGNLFGLGSAGAYNAGLVFELSPSGSGWHYTSLYTFTGKQDGYSPNALTITRDGALVGTTTQGGNTANCFHTGGCGTVFVLNQNAGVWHERTVYTFAGGADAQIPTTGLTFDGAGHYYGVTTAGGYGVYCAPNYPLVGCGVVYKLTPQAGEWQENLVFSFGVNVLYDVSDPSPLLWDSKGILYGTGEGGLDGNGTVFEIDLNQPQQTAPDPGMQRHTPMRPALVGNAGAAKFGKGSN